MKLYPITICALLDQLGFTTIPWLAGEWYPLYSLTTTYRCTSNAVTIASLFFYGDKFDIFSASKLCLVLDISNLLGQKYADSLDVLMAQGYNGQYVNKLQIY